MPIGSHIIVYATLVSHRIIQEVVGVILGTYTLIRSSIGAIVPVVTLEGLQDFLNKSRPVNI